MYRFLAASFVLFHILPFLLLRHGLLFISFLPLSALKIPTLSCHPLLPLRKKLQSDPSHSVAIRSSLPLARNSRKASISASRAGTSSPPAPVALSAEQMIDSVILKGLLKRALMAAPTSFLSSMKFVLLLLSLPFASAVPVSAPAGEALGHSETEWCPTPDETPSSGGCYVTLVNGDDPRTLDDLLTESGLNWSEIISSYENSVFKGFTANLSEYYVGKVSALPGLLMFVPESAFEVFIPEDAP